MLSDTVASVKATGEDELTIKLKKPFAAFPSLLAFSGVCAVSPKAYEIGPGKFKPNIFVGTGAYKLANYGTDSLRFDVFDQYWGTKPENKGVNVQIQTSPVNLFNAFKTGAVDVAYLSLQPDQIQSLEASAKKGDWQAITAQGSVVSYMVLNRNQKPLDKIEQGKLVGYTLLSYSIPFLYNLYNSILNKNYDLVFKISLIHLITIILFGSAYCFRIPVIFYEPGKFNKIGTSHNLMHLGVIILSITEITYIYLNAKKGNIIKSFK